MMLQTETLNAIAQQTKPLREERAFTRQTRPSNPFAHPKLTRSYLQLIALLSLFLWLATSPSIQASPERILILGDSLTAGYGIDPSLAYPAIIQEKIVAADLHFEVAPAGLSGETSAGGLRRVDWVLQRPTGILILALGANDGLRGIPVSTTQQNLQAIIDKAKAKYPDIKLLIAGMQMPPNLGEAYTQSFREIFPNLASENDAALIPFLLDGVGGNPELNLADGIHPTPEGHRIVAENVWAVLQPLLLKQGRSN